MITALQNAYKSCKICGATQAKNYFGHAAHGDLNPFTQSLRGIYEEMLPSHS